MNEKMYNKIAKMLHQNGLDWYVVYTDGKIKLTHETNLSNILQCGHEKSRYGIDAMYRCGASSRKEAEKWLGEM